MNVLVMYDRQTGSYWSQLLGRAVEGELSGTQLEPLTATQTTWANWKSLHPDTKALRKGTIDTYDPYTEYHSSSEAGMTGEARQDHRLHAKALGLGFVANGQPAYFPLIRLVKQRVVNDTVAGEPVLVIFQPDVSTALAFKRSVAGRVLTFEVESADTVQFILTDIETGSRWVAWTGGALDGPLDGEVLERVPATTAFWFGWKDWYPDTYLYEETPTD